MLRQHCTVYYSTKSRTWIHNLQNRFQKTFVFLTYFKCRLTWSIASRDCTSFWDNGLLLEFLRAVVLRITSTVLGICDCFQPSVQHEISSESIYLRFSQKISASSCFALSAILLNAFPSSTECVALIHWFVWLPRLEVGSLLYWVKPKCRLTRQRRWRSLWLQ